MGIDPSSSFHTVARWIQHFSDGRDTESVEDKAHAGRPLISVTDCSGKRAEALRPTTTLRFFVLELVVSYIEVHMLLSRSSLLGP